MKVLVSLSLALLSLGTCRAANMSDIETLYRSILSQQEQSQVPGPSELAEAVAGGNLLRDTKAEQVAAVLSLAASCLASANPVVRKDGMLFMSSVAVARLDNAALLAPYFEKLATFLTDSDAGMKQSAITSLADGYPKPAPDALPYLARHLNDEQNSSVQFLAISGALLAGSPTDPGAVRTVLTALQQRADHEALTGAMIQALGQQRITTAEALQYVRAGLSANSAPVRLTALEAIGRMPKGVRDGFAADLQLLLANPDEPPEIRTRAEHTLSQ